ncbi:MAG: hydrogenase [Deltaproteobacteria bacterium]|nr:hydrogenase [Deltaproteobacteria bacterium]
MVSEWLVVTAVVISALSGVPGLLSPRQGPARERLFTGAMTVAAVCAAVAALVALFGGTSQELSAPWPVPGGQLAIRVDAISAMFVLQIALLAGLGAWYGLAYWPQRDHPRDGRKLRVFYGAVTAGMLLLVVARNGILFLAGWEVMAASAFVLVSTEDHLPAVRDTGYLYILSTRAGTLCLFAMFALLGAAGSSAGAGADLHMDRWPAALSSPLGDAIFVLGLCGFGLKAGAMPLHVWLPSAHANAPSHVSAVMSGVLIKTGIYGLVRLTSLAPSPPAWWGYALVAVGILSGVLGVWFAIGQHDLKRLLAYHSVENIGIIFLGLGVAVLGRSLGRSDLVVLGLAGSLLHVWNHGLFKGLLFLAAGAVVHATGTRQIDRLGGLSRRMPRTSLLFLVGAVAICGLPPLNGLVSELFVYLGLFRAATSHDGMWLAGALGAPALALVGALAVACFVKVFGAVFLGEPRSADGANAHDPERPMLVPMAILAAGCAFVGLGAPVVSMALDVVVAAWIGPGARSAPALSSMAPVVWISATSAGLLVVIVLLTWWLVRRARSTAAEPAVGTWDCGYAAPSARMQYTSSSFAERLIALLAFVLRPSVHPPKLEGLFPESGSFHSHVPDTVLDRVLVPSFRLAARLLGRLRPIQHGKLHLYLLYIFGTLIVLLLWR